MLALLRRNALVASSLFFQFCRVFSPPLCSVFLLFYFLSFFCFRFSRFVVYCVNSLLLSLPSIPGDNKNGKQHPSDLSCSDVWLQNIFRLSLSKSLGTLHNVKHGKSGQEPEWQRTGYGGRLKRVRDIVMAPKVWTVLLCSHYVLHLSMYECAVDEYQIQV